MVEVYKELQRALAAGEKCVLARIIRAIGSAPRSVGTKMLLRADGRLVGTIGGGLLELEVLAEAQKVLASGRPAVRSVRLEGREMAGAEMLCGGNVDVLIEPVSAEDAAAASVFRALAETAAQGRRAVLITVVAEDRRALQRALLAGEGGLVGDVSGRFEAAGIDPQRWAGVRGCLLEPLAPGPDSALVFVEALEPEAKLVLFGAGHIAAFVAPLARTVGFRVCVTDDRAEFANPERFPSADRLLVCPAAEAFERIAVTPATYLAIMTRGHAHDREALRAALKTRPAYLGMIGSLRKRDMIYAALAEEGVPAADLRRIHCPIGLAIGAETPQEIAVSIVAELIQARARQAERNRADRPPAANAASVRGMGSGS
jgi:xanthine dehydrogenase accessory factor